MSNHKIRDFAPRPATRDINHVRARLARRTTSTGMTAFPEIALGTLYWLDLSKTTMLRTDPGDPDCTEFDAAIWARAFSGDDTWGWMPRDLFDILSETVN